MKIDCWAHFLPSKYHDALSKCLGGPYRFAVANPAFVDLDYRFRTMDKYTDLVQVLVPGGPPPNAIASPKKAAELASIYNDALAELVEKYPDRFIAAVAIIATGDTESALKEIDRSINQLKCRGILISTPQYIWDSKKTGLLPKGTKAIDSPELMPVYERMAQYNLPIYIHPSTTIECADYTTEEASKYRIWQIFGWPFHSTAAMTRLVFSGIFDKHPGIKFMIHHAGAMVPFFQRRISVQYDYDEMRFNNRDKQNLRMDPIDYLRMFYVDTAIYECTPALMCAYAFYGAERLLFGTDMPHDCQLGDLSIRETIVSVEQMDISNDEKTAIFANNARKLMRLPI